MIQAVPGIFHLSVKGETVAMAKESISQSQTASTAPIGKYLVFLLGKEEYGVPILRVREIIKIIPWRSVPRVPPHIKGVINLRGAVIPVVDIRLKFGMASVDNTDQTSIIVMEVGRDSPRIQIGMVVDAVAEVVNIKDEDLVETPRFGASVDMDKIMGMARIGKSVKILLDIDRVLSGDELDTFT